MDVENALSRCPFLYNLAQTQGRSYASSFAINPMLSAPSAPRPILQEEQDFISTFRLFHGPSGVVPLARPSLGSTSFNSLQRNSLINDVQPGLPSIDNVFGKSTLRVKHNNAVLQSAPLATMSLNGLPDFGEMFRQLTSRKQPRPPKAQRRLPNNRADISKASARSSGSQALHPTKGGGFSSGSVSTASGGTCPLRKLLGPTLSGFVFDKAGNVHCPPAIIQARAALAATAPVKSLRPQALPVKLIAVGAVAVMLNVPCGMWREHTEKFSTQWWIAVHASIPFIAMLRKAVIMPKIAIVCTIAAAIAGQTMGARMERQRLKDQEALGSHALQLATVEPALVKGKLGTNRGAKLNVSYACSVRHSSEVEDTMDDVDWRLEKPGRGTFKNALRPALISVH